MYTHLFMVNTEGTKVGKINFQKSYEIKWGS